MPLIDYIKTHYGTQKAFAEAIGANQPLVSVWVNKGWIVQDGVLYSPKRQLPEIES